MSRSDPRVRVFPAIRGEPLLEGGVDALNDASRHPTPFNSAGYVQAVLDNDEFAREGQKVLLLAATDDDALVGFLALRRAPVRVSRFTEDAIEFLVTHENERPRLASRPEDEERCARAFFRHLLTEERGFKVLDFANLPRESPLLAPAARPPRGFRSRVLDGLPSAVLPVRRHAGFAGWFASLDRRFRQDISRQVRRMLGAGRVEALRCSDPRGRLPLLEMYLDVERRSWKQELARNPARNGRRRALCAVEQPMEVSYLFLLLDGKPVASTAMGLHRNVFYGLDTCYDAAFARLGPGHLMFLLAIREAFARDVCELNMLGDFAYYKAKWGAEVESTRRLQLFRVGSVHWIKSYVGDWRRRLRRGRGDAPRYNRYKREAERATAGAVTKADGPDGTRAAAPQLASEQALAASTLDALAARGVPVERLSGDALIAALPFTVDASR